MTERLVVIGNGMASLRFLERLTEAAPGRFDVACVGAEPVAAYNRVVLSSLLGGEVDEAACTFRGLDWYAEHGITLDRGNRLDDDITIATMLKNVGYQTRFFGKYLNSYPFGRRPFNPPGWETFQAFVGRYGYYDYTLAGGSKYLHFGTAETDYATDKIGALAVDAARTASPKRPIFMELAPISPHWPFEIAPRHADACRDRTFTLPPNFNATDTRGEPAWLAAEGPKSVRSVTDAYRRTCAMLASVDEMVDAVIRELARERRLANTYVVFTSDNGYHSVAHRMILGKRTAYREDTIVPMVVIGPGVPAGVRTDAVTSTVDLAPTFLNLFGAQGPAWLDGRALNGMLASGTEPPDWRTGVVSESLVMSTPDDPDYEEQSPTPFTALHTKDWLFVAYSNGERELYDEKNDPYELNNLAPRPDPRRRRRRGQVPGEPGHLPGGRAPAGRGDHRPGPAGAERPHPLHPPRQEGPRAVPARGAAARAQLHRHRAHPPRSHPRG